ncbi:MAG: MMPL family transporter [Candidatus Galacturonibacter soehngenii]|nr:MMPL family transporter [Candidatus Galacturonibacter soehngenii]
MNWISDTIIRFRKWIVAIFLIALPLMGICALTVGINYNMMDYLPEDANSTKAIAVMEENFSEGISNANVMIPDLSINQAIEYKEKLLKLPGIKDVMWLDDVADLKQPLIAIDKDTVENYYKDHAALFSVTIEDGEEQSAVNAVYKLIGEKGAITGSAVSQAASQSMAVQEAMKSIVVLGGLIIIILILSTTSWLEPVVFLITIGLAVIINLGACVFTGEISYVTLAVTPILQLAVSLDYAVFLSHSFDANRQKTEDVNLAMKMALKESFKAIFGSAATTFFGFIALLFMDFKIGPNMGVALVRGVVVSYLTIMIFLPAFILCVYKKIDQTKHRSFLPNFTKVGGALVKGRFPVFLIILLLIFPCYQAQKNNSFLYGTGEASKESRLGIDQEKIEKIFGNSNIMAMMVPVGDSASEMLLCQDLEKFDFVKSVTSYTTAVSNKIPMQYLSQEIVSNFYSDKYARIIIYTSLDTEGKVAFAGVEKVRETAASYYKNDVYLCGETVNMYDMMQCVQNDNKIVDTITVISIFLILLLEFKSLLIPVILIITIKTAIWINMSVPYFTGGEMSYIGYMVVSTVMMGATIDYAILLTEHYMSDRKQKNALQAMKDTVGSCMKSMLISSMIMAISGFALGMMSSEEVVKVLGMLLGRGAVIAFVLSVTFLPTLILLFDRLIPYFTLNAKFYVGNQTEENKEDIVEEEPCVES